MRRFVCIMASLGLIAAVIVIIRRVVTGGADTAPPPTPWKPLGTDDVAQPAPTITVVEDEPGASADTDTSGSTNHDQDWVEANDDGSCPNPFPVKAKLSSKIFHVPGGLSYERTNADRCYLNEAAAEADGLRQAKR